MNDDQTYFDRDDDEPQEALEDMLEVATALLVLSEMARERGVPTFAQLGNLPPLDTATKAKYLARARAREAKRGAPAGRSA